MARSRGGGGMGIPRYEPPASLRSASPFCSAKRGGIVLPLRFLGHTPRAGGFENGVRRRIR